MKWFERNLGHNLLVTTSVTHKMEKEKGLVQIPGSMEISNNRVCPGVNNEK